MATASHACLTALLDRTFSVAPEGLSKRRYVLIVAKYPMIVTGRHLFLTILCSWPANRYCVSTSEPLTKVSGKRVNVRLGLGARFCPGIE